MRREIYPFLYETLVERILGSESYRDKVLIWAGRSLGKTGVLDEIEDRLTNQSLEAVARIVGRNDSAVDEIAAWADDPSGVLLLDDLDRAYEDQLEEVLSSLPQDAEGQWRILATVCKLDEVEQRSGWSKSPSINTFHREPLDPWVTQGQAAGAIKDALVRLRQEHPEGTTLAPLLTGQAPDLIEAWVQAILQVSDGHPALLRAAFDALGRLLALYPSLQTVDRRLLTLPTETEALRRWLKDLQEYLEYEVYSSGEGMGAITQAIRFYRRESPFFAKLVEIAKDEEGAPTPSVRVQQSLRSSGLVRRHPGTGRLKVVGELVRDRILELAEEVDEEEGKAQAKKHRRGRGRPPKSAGERKPKKPPIDYDFRIDAIDSTSGELRTFDPPGFPKMTIRGKKWMLLQALEGAGSEPISIEGLRDATSPATDASVRSNLQRLRADLSRHGLGDLIETVHGKGFRLRRKGTT